MLWMNGYIWNITNTTSTHLQIIGEWVNRLEWKNMIKIRWTVAVVHTSVTGKLRIPVRQTSCTGVRNLPIKSEGTSYELLFLIIWPLSTEKRPYIQIDLHLVLIRKSKAYTLNIDLHLIFIKPLVCMTQETPSASLCIIFFNVLGFCYTM